jgi:hypothetical protein
LASGLDFVRLGVQGSAVSILYTVNEMQKFENKPPNATISTCILNLHHQFQEA